MSYAKSCFAIVVCVLGTVVAAVSCGSENDQGASSPDSGSSGGGDSGGGADGGGGSSNPPIPRDEFIAALVDALCSKVEPCCVAGGFDYVEGACSSALSGDAGANVLVRPEHIADPTLSYDPQAAGDCLAALRTVPDICKGPSSANALDLVVGASAREVIACYRMLSGTKQPGEPCTQFECATNGAFYSLCVRADSADGGAVTSGTCKSVTLVPLGAACDPGNPADVGATTVRACADSYENAPDPASYADLDGYVAASVACDPVTSTCKKGSEIYGTAGQPCDDTRQCMPSSYCAANGQCAARVAIGQSCAGARCASGARCEAGTCVAEKADGEPCQSSSECLGECNAKDVCAPRSTLASAALCSGQ